MIAVDPSAALALASALALMLSLLAARRRRQSAQAARREARNSQQHWAPQAARILTVAERRAHDVLCRALPGFLVLAQVPLARFLRVDPRSTDWMQHVGGLSADLLLCDSGSRVLAVIDVRPGGLSDGGRRRHERMTRVLRSAGIKVLSWHEDALPDAAMARAQLLPLLAAPSAARAAPSKPPVSRPMPLIPVAEIEEFLAAGDAESGDALEPVPSAMFEDLEPVPTAAARR